MGLLGKVISSSGRKGMYDDYTSPKYYLLLIYCHHEITTTPLTYVTVSRHQFPGPLAKAFHIRLIVITLCSIASSERPQSLRSVTDLLMNLGKEVSDEVAENV